MSTQLIPYTELSLSISCERRTQFQHHIAITFSHRTRPDPCNSAKHLTPSSLHSLYTSLLWQNSVASHKDRTFIPTASQCVCSTHICITRCSGPWLYNFASLSEASHIAACLDGCTVHEKLPAAKRPWPTICSSHCTKPQCHLWYRNTEKLGFPHGHQQMWW